MIKSAGDRRRVWSSVLAVAVTAAVVFVAYVVVNKVFRLRGYTAVHPPMKDGKKVYQGQNALLAGAAMSVNSESLYNRVKDGDLTKMGTFLGALVEMEEQQDVKSRKGDDDDDDDESLVVVEVIGVFDEGLRESLERVDGVEVVGCYAHVCTAYCSVKALPKVSKLDSVLLLEPSMVRSSTGSITSEGDQAMLADTARAMFNVNGTGIKVGVLSTSYDMPCSLISAADDITTGNLPDNPADIQIIRDFPPELCSQLGGGLDEGRAMMQIVHDVAPGAKLAFRTGFIGAADAATGILELALVGCDVIVDDLGYPTEPWFQDSVVAQAASFVAEQGISYFSAAGNFNRKSWVGADGFVDSGINITGGAGTDYGIAHSFGTDPATGDPIISQEITFPNTGGITLLHLQWDQPARSASNLAGSESDVDLIAFYRIPFTNSLIELASTKDNNIGGNPWEAALIDLSLLGLPTDDSITVNFAITLKRGSPPGYLKVILDSNDGVFQFATRSSTLFGQQNAPLVGAIGAAAFTDTPAFGVDPPEIEPFSAAGGTPIFFDPEGRRLQEPRVPLRPNVVGPDGGATTFFGRAADDGFQRFFGTSAAAPHVAGVAALMRSFDATLSTAQVIETLQATATDMDDPATEGFDEGFDFGTGYGLVNAEAALAALASGEGGGGLESDPPSDAPTIIPITLT